MRHPVYQFLIQMNNVKARPPAPAFQKLTLCSSVLLVHSQQPFFGCAGYTRSVATNQQNETRNQPCTRAGGTWGPRGPRGPRGPTHRSEGAEGAKGANGIQRAKIVEKVHKPSLGTLADARVKKEDHV